MKLSDAAKKHRHEVKRADHRKGKVMHTSQEAKHQYRVEQQKIKEKIAELTKPKEESHE